MRSIARRIQRLEASLLPDAEMQFLQWPGRRKFRGPGPSVKLRFGNLHRLPEDYQGERHVELVKRLPDRNGQEWGEFEEVPGPDPSLPLESSVPEYINVVFVGS